VEIISCSFSGLCPKNDFKNVFFRSPAGQFIVLAGMRTMNGVLEFIDTNDFTVMNSGDHFMCTDIEWDPTGRYVMTGVSWWGHKVMKKLS